MTGFKLVSAVGSPAAIYSPNKPSQRVGGLFFGKLGSLRPFARYPARSGYINEPGHTLIHRLKPVGGKMRFSCSVVAGFVLAIWVVGASAQQAVRPQWNYQGSAVCPEGYDYLGGLCRARGYGGPRYGYGGGVEPRWNRRGSAVCPEGYDYHARSGLCRPQRY